jgi:hypothetical protein
LSGMIRTFSGMRASHSKAARAKSNLEGQILQIEIAMDYGKVG